MEYKYEVTKRPEGKFLSGRNANECFDRKICPFCKKGLIKREIDLICINKDCQAIFRLKQKFLKEGGDEQ